MRARVVVHLKSGRTVEGAYEETTQAEIEVAKEGIADAASHSDGWEIHLPTAEGWACVPGSSIDYIALEVVG